MVEVLCGRGLVGVTSVGVAIARFARKGHAHKGHTHEATPTKASSYLEPLKVNSWSMDAKIHSNHAKIIVGVAIKSGRGKVKGSDINYPPPYVHKVSQIELEKRHQ